MDMNGWDFNRNAAGAILFLQSAYGVMGVYSAVNSSPWTAESFGGDPEKAESCLRYVRHAMVLSTGYGIAASAISKSWWPLVGTLIATAYMVTLYNKALHKATAMGSVDWTTGKDGVSS